MSKTAVLEKYSIEETALLPLYARVLAGRLYPELFPDPEAEALLERLDHDCRDMEKRSKKRLFRLSALMAVMRQRTALKAVSSYIKTHPNALVVSLGGGLFHMREKIDNGSCRFLNIDREPVVSMRRSLFDENERERELTADLRDPSWLSAIDFRMDEGIIFEATGVLMYLEEAEVRMMLAALSGHFPGGAIVFDTLCPSFAKAAVKAVEGAPRKPFALTDPIRELDVPELSYDMIESRCPLSALPYEKLGFFYRLAGRYIDKKKICQSVTIYFRE